MPKLEIFLEYPFRKLSFKTRTTVMSSIKKCFLAFSLVLSVNSCLAASSYCFYPDPFSLSVKSCKTGSVPANKNGHFIYFEVSSYTHYYVRDQETGKLVRQGIASWNGTSGLVFGLYGNEYTVEIRDAPAGKAYINNT